MLHKRLIIAAIFILSLRIIGVQAQTVLPTNVDAILEMGSKLLSNGQLDNAEHCFRTALTNLPYLPEAYLGIAKVHQKRNDIDGAIKDLLYVLPR